MLHKGSAGSRPVKAQSRLAEDPPEVGDAPGVRLPADLPAIVGGVVLHPVAAGGALLHADLAGGGEEDGTQRLFLPCHTQPCPGGGATDAVRRQAVCLLESPQRPLALRPEAAVHRQVSPVAPELPLNPAGPVAGASLPHQRRGLRIRAAVRLPLPPEAEVVVDPPGRVEIRLPLLGELHAAAAIQHQRPVRRRELPEKRTLELPRRHPQRPVREAAQEIAPIREAQKDHPSAPAGNGGVGMVGVGLPLPEEKHTGDEVVIALHLAADGDTKLPLPAVPAQAPVGVRVVVQDLAVGLHIAVGHPALRIKEGPVDHHVGARPLSDLAGRQRFLFVRDVESDLFQVPQRHRHGAASHFHPPRD